MTSSRQKGLAYVREVRKLLQSRAYKVEGPGYKPVFLPTGMRAVHSDYFSVYDLMSYRYGCIKGHQVSTLTNKAAKVKALLEENMCGYVWCRVSGPKDYRVWWVNGQFEEEIFLENL